jgi:hypothetical protein
MKHPVVRLAALIAGVILLAAGFGLHFHVSLSGGSRSGSSDHSADIEAAAGAVGCEKTPWYIESRFDKSRSTLYDCIDARGRHRCFTWDDGVARDETEAARLLIAGVYSAAGKPSCVGAA